MAATVALPGLTDLLATLGGRRVLSGRVHDSEDLLVRVRAGLPYAALESLQAGYGFDGDLLREVLDVPARTLARRKSSRRFSPEESDRLFRMARIVTLAMETLGGKDAAREWLQAPNRALGGDVPLRRLDTDLGARQVEGLLGRIAHGVFS
jgi:putative toxin-antitoxin system antitoxin component (TIGR02293 family)